MLEGLAFDLLIWSEAEDWEHEGRGAYGVVETDRSLARDVDLDYVETIIEHGGGTYFWTVMVVQVEPYSRVGAWGENRSFIYVEPEPPAERSTQGPLGKGGQRCWRHGVLLAPPTGTGAHSLPFWRPGATHGGTCVAPGG
jgi:hypothetical protein